MSGPGGKPVTGEWVVGDHPDAALLRVQGPTFKAVAFGDDGEPLARDCGTWTGHWAKS